MGDPCPQHSTVITSNRRPSTDGTRIIEGTRLGSTRSSSWCSSLTGLTRRPRQTYANNFKNYDLASADLADGKTHQREVALGNAWLLDPLPPTSRISASRDSSEAPRDRTRQSHEPLELHTSTVWTTAERPIHGLHSTIILADGPLTVDATLHRDTNLTPKELGPTLPWCLQHRGLFHPLSQFQNEIIQDIRNLGADMHEETMEVSRTAPTRTVGTGISDHCVKAFVVV